MFTKLHNAHIDVSKLINMNMLFRLLADNTFIWNGKAIGGFFTYSKQPGRVVCFRIVSPVEICRLLPLNRWLITHQYAAYCDTTLIM